MTRAELIQTIRAEIDKLYGKYKDKFLQCGDQYHLGLIDGLDMAERVLDTLEESNFKDFPTTDEEIAKFLATHPKVEVPEKYKTPDWVFEESEKPINQRGLDKEINRYLEPIHTADIQFEPFTQMTKCARHFAQWGYLRAAEKYDEVEYNRQRAEEEMPLPEDTVLFNKGVEEGKRLMMEEAVEGYVNYYEDSGGILMAEAQVGCPYHSGDKVRIIIVKESEK